MPELAPISAAFDARVEPCSLDRRYAVVDSAFAERLRTEHSRRFEVAATRNAFGDERITRDVPNVGEEALACLGEDGLVRAGTPVEPGMLLVGKTTPIGGGELSSEEKLLRAIFGEKASHERDTSLRVPPGCFGVVTEARLALAEPGDGAGEAEPAEPLARASVEVAWERPLDVGDVLLVGGEPVVVADIRALAADLAWSGGRSSVSVAKAAMARDVIHARSIGSYSPRTQQPTRGRERFGGQALLPEQLELLATHAPWALWEMLTIKSDAVIARTRSYESIVEQESPDVLSRGEGGGPAPVGTAGGGMSDIFSFFERPAAPAPGEVVAVLPEAITTLVAFLRALGLDLQARTAEVAVALLSAEALREGSHGAIRLPETVDARTQAPIPGGLYCPKIFGPIKDYECACGKYKRMKHRGVVCESCGVEVIQSKVRRERFGHVELCAPCLHPLLVPEAALLLELPEDELREVVAGQRVLAAEGPAWRTEPGESTVGGQALHDALATLDLEAIDAIEAGPRADVASALLRAGLPATVLMLTVLPVLPPVLRPVTSGLTHAYRTVVNRNNRLARLRELDAPPAVVANEHAQLQVAIDRLMINHRLAQPATDTDAEPRPSLAQLADDRFARHVFTKRVDFSGVAHLVADPSLAYGECRVPQAMLIELFRPHAYGMLEARGYTTTIKSAKRMVDARRPEALLAIEAASDDHPVLLMAGGTVVSRRIRSWDAPAIAVDPSTASRLASHTVTVHVPLMHEAALQCASLSEIASPEPAHAEGWLCRARTRGAIVDAALAAALHGDGDALDDPIVALALGRPPAALDADELARHAEHERERRDANWARLQPPPEDPAHDARTRNPALDRRVDELELSVATANRLQDAGIETIADLCRRTKADLLRLRGFGRKHLAELEQILADLGLSLGMRDV